MCVLFAIKFTMASPDSLALTVDHIAKFVSDPEIEIRSLITKLHKTLSFADLVQNIYAKN